MKKILITYDMSGDSRKAMSFALELAKGSKAELVVLFVRSKYDNSFIKEAEATEEEAKNKIKEMIKNAIKTVVRSGIKVEGVILKGEPAEKIIEYSDENNIDLVIMGAKGITNSEKYKLGSVAEKVVRYAKKPVLIAR